MTDTSLRKQNNSKQDKKDKSSKNKSEDDSTGKGKKHSHNKKGNKESKKQQQKQHVNAFNLNNFPALETSTQSSSEEKLSNNSFKEGKKTSNNGSTGANPN